MGHLAVTIKMIFLFSPNGGTGGVVQELHCVFSIKYAVPGFDAHIIIVSIVTSFSRGVGGGGLTRNVITNFFFN